MVTPVPLHSKVSVSRVRKIQRVSILCMFNIRGIKLPLVPNVVECPLTCVKDGGNHQLNFTEAPMRVKLPDLSESVNVELWGNNNDDLRVAGLLCYVLSSCVIIQKAVTEKARNIANEYSVKNCDT